MFNQFVAGKILSDTYDKIADPFEIPVRVKMDQQPKSPRMAGKALEADTPVATEAAESVKKSASKAKGGKYQSGQQHYSEGKLVDTGAPSEKYPGDDNNPYTVKNIEDFNLSAGGAGAKKGTERLSAQDIKRLREQGGFSRQQIVDYAENQDFGDGPGASGGKAQALLSKYKDAIAANKGKKEEDVEPVTEPTTAPTPTAQETDGSAAIGDNSNASGPQQADTAIGGGTQQTQIAGDNNTVTNNQAIDNSRSYGGSNRIFNYQGTGDLTKDTPVSAATMAGFYDVDDSPAANASRLDRQVDQNRQNQQYYQERASNITQNALDGAEKNTYIDPAALDKRVSAGAQNMFDMSTLMGANIFGDISAGKAPTWNSPKAPEKIEKPDFEAYGKKYIDSF